MLNKRVLGALSGLVLAIGVSVGAAGPASAYSNVTWNDCFGGYAGSSWYSTSGLSYSSTQRVDGCGYVAAAIRYYTGYGNFVTSSSDYISTNRAVAAYGGKHWSRSNGNAVNS